MKAGNCNVCGVELPEQTNGRPRQRCDAHRGKKSRNNASPRAPRVEEVPTDPAAYSDVQGVWRFWKWDPHEHVWERCPEKDVVDGTLSAPRRAGE